MPIHLIWTVIIKSTPSLLGFPFSGPFRCSQRFIPYRLEQSPHRFPCSQWFALRRRHSWVHECKIWFYWSQFFCGIPFDWWPQPNFQTSKSRLLTKLDFNNPNNRIAFQITRRAKGNSPSLVVQHHICPCCLKWFASCRERGKGLLQKHL